MCAKRSSGSGDRQRAGKNKKHGGELDAKRRAQTNTAPVGLLASFAFQLRIGALTSMEHAIWTIAHENYHYVNLRRKFGDGIDPEWYANWAGYLAVKRYREQQSEIAER